MEPKATIRAGFVTGLILIAPLVITLFVINLLYSWFIGLLTPFIAVVYSGEVDVVVQIVSLIIVFSVITVLGLTFRRGVGRRAVLEFDHLMGAIPVVRTLYTSAREASNALVGHQERFNRVAFVEWPGAEIHTIGFVTGETAEGAAQAFDDDESRYDVFVPMSPNPMGGFLAIVPDSRLVMTDLTVRQGLQIVLTTGLSGEPEAVSELSA